VVKLFSKTPRTPSFEQFFGEISLRLLQSEAAVPNTLIETILRDIGEHYGVDRVHLRWAPLEQQSGDTELDIVAGWVRKDTGSGKAFTAQEVSWIMARLRAGQVVRINDLDELPKEAETDRVALQARGIRAALILGLTLDADMFGVFTLSTWTPFAWSDRLQREVSCLRSLLTKYCWDIKNRARLRENEARYRGIVQDQSDLIVRWTPDGRSNWVNDRVSEYLEMPREALIGKDVNWLIADPYWPKLRADVANLTPENPSMAGEYQDTLPNGKRVWQEWIDRGIFDEDGTLLEIQSVGRDITERKTAEEAREREAAFQRNKAELLSALTTMRMDDADATIQRALEKIGSLYGAARIGIWWLSEQKDAVSCTHRWFEEGAPPPPFPYTVSRADFQWVFDLLLSGGRVQIRDIDEVPANATELRDFMELAQVRSYLACPLVVDGQILGSITTSATQANSWNDTAIDEMEVLANILATTLAGFRAADALATREKDLERSQRVAKVGSYRIQATLNNDDSPDLLNVLSFTMSTQAQEIFGVETQPDPRAQVLSMLASIHPDDEPRVRETWLKTLQEGTEHTIEYRVIGPEGSTIHVQAREQFDGTDSNGVITFFGTYKDITEWVEANRELQSALSQVEELTEQLQQENVLLRDEVRAAHGFDKIIGTSSGLRVVLEAVRQVAPTDVTVLISGETGTGKELVAQSIHDLSDRKAKPMVSVNCAALSPELIESELFGHEKGAFTGAHARRKGRFEITDGGTLFLDEIGEMSGDLQAKLLRVIQEGEFERLGGSTTLKTDVRLIAATNRNLVEEMDSGRFRADLYYRINAFPIELPPLRERIEDIPLLASHLVRKHATILGKEVTSMSARMLRHLQEQDWPGNIRELEGTLLRALISTAGPVLDYIDESGVMNVEAAEDASDSLSLLDAQRKHVVDVLERTRWVIEGKKGAAAALGLAPSSLRSKMQRLNIVRPSRKMAS